MKKCIMLSLYAPCVDVYEVERLRKYGYDLITMNDWYFHFPTIKSPNMIFNIHMQDDYSMFHHEGRWVNWEEQYNEAGCPIVVKRSFPKLNSDKLVFYPTDEMVAKFGKNTFTCQAVYMLAYLVDKLGYKEILMMGSQMIGSNPEEYCYQIPAILNIIDQIRECYDTVIECPLEQRWREFMVNNNIDYKNLRDIENIYE